MNTKHKSQHPHQPYFNQSFQKYYKLSHEEEIELAEELGIPVFQSNEGWIRLLRQRLDRQKQEFQSLLDHAAEQPELLDHCKQFRREIQATCQRLSDCRALRAKTN